MAASVHRILKKSIDLCDSDLYDSQLHVLIVLTCYSMYSYMCMLVDS